MVPALCGFGWTGKNWAEIGHASMKPRKQLWLSYACYVDVCHMIMQGNEYISFIQNKGKTVGCGPSTVRMARKEKEAEDRFMDQALDALESGNIEDEALYMESSDHIFIPSATAKHRVPKTFSTKNPLQKYGGKEKHKCVTFECDTDIEGNVDSDEPEEDNVRLLPNVPDKRVDTHEENICVEEEEQEGVEEVTNSSTIQPSTSKTKRLPDQRHRGKNLKYADTSDETNKDADEGLQKYNKMLVPTAKEKEKLKENPPIYVRMWNRVKRCSGCERQFAEMHRKAPNDLIFHYKMKQVYFDVKLQKRIEGKEIQNAYFHARDLTCLRQVDELENLGLEDIYIENHTFRTLKKEDIDLLRRRGHWKQLCINRATLIDK